MIRGVAGYCLGCAERVGTGLNYCLPCADLGDDKAGWWFYQWVRGDQPIGPPSTAVRLRAIDAFLRKIGDKLTRRP